MKKVALASVTIATALMLATPVQARDELVEFDIAQAMEEGREKGVVNDNIKMVFGTKPEAAKNLGEFVSNKKTNAFAKSDNTACNWAFLGAVKSLQQRAVKEGGNAVINIHSYYKKNVYSSEEKFQCGAGAVIAGVALRGEVVKL